MSMIKSDIPSQFMLPEFNQEIIFLLINVYLNAADGMMRYLSSICHKQS